MVPIFAPTIISFVLLTAQLLKSAKSQEITSIGSTYLHSNCSGDRNFKQGSEYQTNLSYLLSNLTSNSGSRKFYNSTIGKNPDKVYGLYYCYLTIDNQLCQKCIHIAATRIRRNCKSSKEAIVWYQYCMLRYANRYIFSNNDVSKYYLWKDGPAKYGPYDQQRSQTLIGLFDKATSGCSPSGSGHSASLVSVVEADLYLSLRAECTPDLTKSDCRSCLQAGLSRYQPEGHRLGVIFQPSCILGGVFNQPRPSSATAIENHTKLYIATGVTSAIAGIALMFTIILISCLKRRKVPKKPAGLEEIESIENLHIELDVIKAATSNFSEENKLGQGGFGVVYKGILGDGQAIAVKRLSNTSKQGIREFKTETCLAAKLQHNNLIKVYGFCLESNEMLLVYEFIPNKSLDRLLFDAQRGAFLKWETRYKIILGIARGLQYLHENSNPKIIHRDLKPSNILLDGEMNPKIADFGLAKLFGGDQSQANTSKIAGTFGYMSPEYATSGHISIKSDVFSYGVILLEIASGMRNRFSDPNAEYESLLSHAWKLWKEGKLLNLVDLALSSNFPTVDIERCIQVGLLCTQENPVKRPNMTSVLIMLNTQLNVELPLPTSPPIFPYKKESTNASQGSIGVQVEDIISELSPR